MTSLEFLEKGQDKVIRLGLAIWNNFSCLSSSISCLPLSLRRLKQGTIISYGVGPGGGGGVALMAILHVIPPIF